MSAADLPQTVPQTVPQSMQPEFPTLEAYVGNTPLVKLQRLAAHTQSTVLLNSKAIIRRDRSKIGQP